MGRPDIAQVLKDIRADRDLNQDDAARLIGASGRQWQRWEAGTSRPQHGNLVKIVDTYGVSSSLLHRPDDDPPQEISLRELTASLTARLAAVETLLLAIARPNEASGAAAERDAALQRLEALVHSLRDDPQSLTHSGPDALGDSG